MQSIPSHLLLATFVTAVSYAHQQPTTLVVLDVSSDHVTMNLHVPLSELSSHLDTLSRGSPNRRSPHGGRRSEHTYLTTFTR